MRAQELRPSRGVSACRSDHGYKLGEWRIGCSKQHPYESDVHVPFFARGPGIKPGTRITELAANIDITPTFINIAGHFPSPDHDGRSMLPLLTGHGSAAAAAAEPLLPAASPNGELAAAAGPSSLEEQQLAKPWRTSLIIEYLSVGTYFNDHAKIWGKNIPVPADLWRDCPDWTDYMCLSTVAGPWGNGSLVEYGAGPYSPDPSTVDNNSSNCAATEGEGLCYFLDSKASNNWIALRVSETSMDLRACMPSDTTTDALLWLAETTTARHSQRVPVLVLSIS
jgi:hypothetical protein